MNESVTVNDKMQTDYSYIRTEPLGGNFDPEFKPHLTPKEMLELGIFGGKYMNDCRDEFPVDWFTYAKTSSAGYNAKLNFFQIRASQSLAEWKKKGWIHSDDPRGWFQWYCRYYMGRRHSDDVRQIQRWCNMKRHVSALQNACRFGDTHCQRRRRQALLHWGYDSRKL